MMFRSSSALHFLLLAIVLGSSLNLIKCDDDESVEAPPEPEEEHVAESEAESEEVTERRAPAAGGIDLEECNNPTNATKEKCCKDSLDIDSAFMKCIVLHQKKMPKENEKNPQVLVKFLSCLVECVYKAKKYIGKGDSLNMKMIKSDANKLHKDSPRERDYMIEMYQYCEQHAATEWGGMKKNPAARAIFAGSCKPYLMWVFICVLDYGKVSCPHFKWKGKKDTVAICEQMKENCEEMLNG